TAIDGGAMTQILKKMTEKQLLHIIKDEHDKRKRVIQLQPAGTQLQLKAESIPAQIRCKFPSISESEATQLISLLDKINSDLT
ncbi:MarR family winged helix-turn-helix transcriptional regulator, partial [Streptomyces scabiei]